MYITSKERLRATSAERERRHVSAGAIGANTSDLTETAISEEPSANDDSFPETHMLTSLPVRSSSMPRPVPDRDSSLRKTGSNAKRLSHRTKRDSGAPTHDTILERDEREQRQQDRTAVHHRHSHGRPDLEAKSRKHGPPHDHQTSENSRAVEQKVLLDESIEDGAPFPAVHSGRRRSASANAERRKSGHLAPEPGEALKTKRSNSKLKRMSGAKSPEPGDRHTISPGPHVGYERPRSADSIDDAVEAYLCSPRLSQKIRHPQTGRVISFSEVGDSEGSAVFCCVSMGLTRYITAFYDELALTLKLRLITPDRPGVGDSEPYSDGTATPLGWPGRMRKIPDLSDVRLTLKQTMFMRSVRP